MYQCWMLKGAKILYDRLTLTSLIPILWKIEKKFNSGERRGQTGLLEQTGTNSSQACMGRGWTCNKEMIYRVRKAVRVMCLKESIR